MGKARQYSAAIILVTVALVFNVLHIHGEWLVEQYPHTQVQWYAEAYRAVFENMQSEVWQIFIAAYVFKHYFWKGTPESKEVE